MMLRRKKKYTNTGLETSGNNAERLINRDGSLNIVRKNFKFNMFHELINMPLAGFMALLLVIFLAINFVFAIIYLIIGVEQLGIETVSFMDDFYYAFYFSSQTITTVGYGAISPTGHGASFIAALESFFGLLSFALASGLIYGRFSRPQPMIGYSDNALIAPYSDGNGLMIRIANNSKGYITNVKARFILSILKEDKNGRLVRRFRNLKLELDEITFLSMNWTIVHSIDSHSPLFRLTEEDLKHRKFELIVHVEGFDKTYGREINSQTSYINKDFVIGAKFDLPYMKGEDSTIFDILKLHDYIPAELNEWEHDKEHT